MARARSVSADNVAADVLEYLAHRYPPTEAEERRQLLTLTIARLVRKGRPSKALHEALVLGVSRWKAHALRKMTKPERDRWNVKVERARKARAQLIADLRALLPRTWREPSDESLLGLSHVVLQIVALPSPEHRPSRGRPWAWKQATEAALREAGVNATDRHELLNALGFIDTE